MFLLLFLNYWLFNSCIPVVIPQVFRPIAELVISLGIPGKEVKSEIEILFCA